jgi:L-threonylcarbamoyladenylate synthase
MLRKKQGVFSDNILRVDRKKPSLTDLKKAVTLLQKGGLVAFPTDTFYGLGADVFCKPALERIYQVKGRDTLKPILVVVPNIAKLQSLTTRLSKQARSLMDRFWPGPLTLLLPARSNLPSLLVGETGKIGVRIPDHPLAVALLKEWNGPLTATSANPSGQRSPRSIKEIEASFRLKLDLIIDAGPTTGGNESTIVDTTLHPPRLVRKGQIPFESIMEAIGLTLTDEHDW